MFQLDVRVVRPLIDEVLGALEALQKVDVGHGRIDGRARGGGHLCHCSWPSCVSEPLVLVQECLACEDLLTRLALENPHGDTALRVSERNNFRRLRLVGDADFDQRVTILVVLKQLRAGRQDGRTTATAPLSQIRRYRGQGLAGFLGRLFAAVGVPNVAFEEGRGGKHPGAEVAPEAVVEALVLVADVLLEQPRFRKGLGADLTLEGLVRSLDVEKHFSGLGEGEAANEAGEGELDCVVRSQVISHLGLIVERQLARAASKASSCELVRGAGVDEQVVEVQLLRIRKRKRTPLATEARRAAS